jgi:hypothetical protein
MALTLSTMEEIMMQDTSFGELPLVNAESE